MLSNAYFVAKFRFDTAENEPAKNLQNFRKMHFRKMQFRKMHLVHLERRSTAPVVRRRGASRCSARRRRPQPREDRPANLGAAFSKNAVSAGSGKLQRARSRLYRSQILQESMRLKALAEIYTMHSFAQL